MAIDMSENSKRFNEKIKRLQKTELERYFNGGTKSIPKANGDVLQVPIRKLELPRFKFDESQMESVGMDGGLGEAHGTGIEKPTFAELNLEDAAAILAEKFELPNLVEKFAGNLGMVLKGKYNDIDKVGPNSLRHMKRSFLRALRRTQASRKYNPQKPSVVVQRSDLVYRAAKPIPTPVTKAAIIYIKDRSDSTHRVIEYQKNVAFWTDAWITSHYQGGVARRFIDYDSEAQEVPREDFFTIRAGGGTSMRAGLSLARKIISKDYPESEYNVFPVHFTDGDCSGMNVQADLEEYRAMIEEIKKDFPGDYSEIEDEVMDIENPLTDFLIPRSSAIFVCESIAHDYGDKYSELLEKIVRDSPALQHRVRYISHTIDEIEKGRGAKITETLLHWFKD